MGGSGSKSGGKSSGGGGGRASEVAADPREADRRNTALLRESKDPIAAWMQGVVPARHLVSNASAWARALVDLPPDRREIAIALIHLFSAEKRDALGDHLAVDEDRLRLLAHWVGDDCYTAPVGGPGDTPTTCTFRTRVLEILWPSRSFQPFQSTSADALNNLAGQAAQFNSLLVTLAFPAPGDRSGSSQLHLLYVDRSGGIAAKGAAVGDATGDIYVTGGRDDMSDASRAQLSKMEALLNDDVYSRKAVAESIRDDPDAKSASFYSGLNETLAVVRKEPTSCEGGVRVGRMSGQGNTFDPDCMPEGWMAALSVPVWAIDAARGKTWADGAFIETDTGAGNVSGLMVSAAVHLLTRTYILSREATADAILKNARHIAWLVRWLGSERSSIYNRRLDNLSKRWADPRFEPFALRNRKVYGKSRDALSDTYPGAYVLGYTSANPGGDRLAFVST